MIIERAYDNIVIVEHNIRKGKLLKAKKKYVR